MIESAVKNNVDKLVSHLESLGFAHTEAIVYLCLHRIGSAQIGNICSHLELDRNITYRVLNKLRTQGLVSSSFSNPPIYRALEPTKMLEVLLEKKEEDLMIAQKAVKKAKLVFNEFQYPSIESSFPTLVVVQGRRNIYTRIAKLIRESKHLVYIVSTEKDLVRMYHTTIPEEINKSRSLGYEVRVITEINGGDVGIFEIIKNLNASEVRTTKLPSKSRIIVGKNNQVMMSGGMKDNEYK